jgi:hypothetical protein
MGEDNMPPVLHRLRPSHLLKYLCSDQVKLLLERMDSHPQEFIHSSKWDYFLPPSLKDILHIDLGMYKHLTLVEKLAIYFKYRGYVREIARPFAYGQILEIMIDEGHKTEPFAGEIK